MKKFALFASGASAALAVAVFGAGQASAAAPDVTGEMYGKAVSILKSQGYKAMFGGSIGSDLPQSQCLVIDQQGGSNGIQRLRLDCNLQPGQDQPVAPNTHSLVPPGGSVPKDGAATSGSGTATAPAAPGRPTPGAGTVTVTPVPIG
ncbi:hypothetical protein [Mycolicibacterium palauense]|uniref:hypothetical protein n=1 Tax=Mycolicibacterium palauense TaxID=2034511 RepID=UPI000BFEB4CC|nr:hypothetical protein [Mycolicibacterium palauense]